MIVIGSDCDATRRIVAGLGATLVTVPGDADDRAWENWRHDLGTRKRETQIVVALFPEVRSPCAVMALSTDAWIARGEEPLLHWMMALGAAALCCADGGSIVAVVDSAPPLDSAGLAAESGVAEAVETLVRSLALSEGKRGVRVNTVTTPCRVLNGPPIAPDPPLAGFPGTLDEDVLGAVRLLLSDDAAWLSGRCLPADRGRSW